MKHQSVSITPGIGRNARWIAASMTAAAVVGSTCYLLAPAAQAVPVPQQACVDFGPAGYFNFTTSDGLTPIPNLAVTVDNGSSSQRVVTTLNIDAGVDDHAEIRVSYRVDGQQTPEYRYGAGNLANHSEFYQTRSAAAVIPLSRGTHTIQPVVRISGTAGMSGHLQAGCFIAEGRTS
jgi:hypothetical protein